MEWSSEILKNTPVRTNDRLVERMKVREKQGQVGGVTKDSA